MHTYKPFELVTTKTVTVEDVYVSPPNQPDAIPEGFEPTGEFRIPLANECYLWCRAVTFCSENHTEPRIILREKPKPPKEYSSEEILNFTLRGIRRHMNMQTINKWLPSRYGAVSRSEEEIKKQIVEQMRKEGL